MSVCTMHFPIRYLFLIWGISIYPKYKELTFPWMNTYLFQIPPKCNRNIRKEYNLCRKLFEIPRKKKNSMYLYVFQICVSNKLNQLFAICQITIR